jgi:lysophospholipase L1-like esterase
MKKHAMMIIIAAWISTGFAANNYRERYPDSTWAAQFRGVTGTNTAGITVAGTYNTAERSHVFPVTVTGLYYSYVDPAGGTNYTLDSRAGWTGGKIIPGTDLATFWGFLNSSKQVRSIGLGDTSVSAAKLKDMALTWAKLDSTARDSIIAHITAGSVTEIQFNDGGVFGTDSQFTYDKSTNVMTVKKAMTDSVAVVDKLMIGSAAGVEFGSSGGGVITMLAPSDAESDFTLRIPDPATNATMVVTEGAQTVNGVKTFGSFPVTPSSAPTTDYQAANKKYVDDAAAPAGADTEVQFNKSGGKGSDADFTYNESTNIMTVKKAMTDSVAVVDKLMIGSAAGVEFGSSGGGVITMLAPSDAESDFTLRIPDPATNATLVVSEGAQTVNGVKTFGSFPLTPSSAPTSNYQVANKKYVDDKVIADSAHIANNAVTSETIVDGQVKTADLAANAVDSTKIKNDAVTSESIQNLQVKTADLAASAVDSSKIAHSAVRSSDIGDGQVKNADIATGTIDTTRFAKQLRTLANEEVTPNFIGQLGKYGNDIMIATSLTNAAKWWKLQTDWYPYEPTSVGQLTGGAPDIELLRKFIIEIKVTGRDPSKLYSLGSIKRNNSGTWLLYLYEHNADLSGLASVAKFETTTTPENGEYVTIHTLTESGSSGVSGKIAVSWSEIPDGSYFSNLWTYENKFNLTDDIWDATKCPIITAYENTLADIGQSDSLSTLFRYAMPDTDKHILTNTIFQDTLYRSPHGLSEHNPSSSYANLGVGMVWRADKDYYFTKLLVNVWQTSTEITTRIKIYKSDAGGDSYTSYDLSTLTFCDSINYTYFATTDDLNEIVLNNPVHLLAGEYLFVLFGRTGGATSSNQNIGRWTSDSEGWRLAMLYNSNANPFTAGTWTRANINTYDAPPPILMTSELSFAKKDTLNKIPLTILQNLSDSDGQLLYNGQSLIPSNPSLLLPDTVWCAVGQEMNIYFDNVTLVNDYHDLLFKVVCDSGVHYSQRWAYTPAAGASGSFDFSLFVYDSEGVLLDADTVHVSVATKSTSHSNIILFIGDSLTDQYTYPHEVSTLYGDSLIFIGTRDSGGDSTANEGDGGTSWQWWESNVASPLVSSGHVDFRAYLTANSLADPDMVIIGLGTNDMFAATEKSDADIETVFQYADSVINNIIADVPGVKIGVSYLVPPSYEQDAFGENYYSGYSRGIFKRSQHKYNQRLKERYGAGGSKYNAQVSLVPLFINLDTEHNMATLTKAYNARNSNTFSRQSNGVHPGTDGYEQMADTAFSWICAKW